MMGSDAGAQRRAEVAQPAPGADAADRRLAGEVGAEVAAALSQALERVNEILHSGRVGRQGLNALRDEIERARQIAIVGQRVSRLAAGRVRQAPELLDLPTVLHGALRQRAEAIAARGLEVRLRLRPASVSADASLLFALLDSLLDWAFAHCAAPLPVLHLATEVNTWPVHAMLRCEFAWRAPDQQDPPAERSALDSLDWRLVEQAAAAMGVGLQREDAPNRVLLSLAFDETARRWPKLVDGDAAPGEGPFGAPLAGHQMLVLARGAELHHAVRAVAGRLGLEAEFATSAAEALACGQRALQHVLVADQATPGLELLCRELHAGASGPALVLIGDLPPGLEICITGRTELTRIGRDAVPRELPLALQYALSGC